VYTKKRGDNGHFENGETNQLTAKRERPLGIIVHRWKKSGKLLDNGPIPSLKGRGKASGGTLCIKGDKVEDRGTFIRKSGNEGCTHVTEVITKRWPHLRVNLLEHEDGQNFKSGARGLAIKEKS